MMKLYHGSSEVDIELFETDHKCFRDYDFGDGTYFTSNFDKAKEWACNNERKEGAVYEIDIDDNLPLVDLDCKILTKEDDDLYYLFYICRIGLKELTPDFIVGFEKYDVVTGPVLRGKKKASMDRYKDMAERFNEGEISFEELKNNTHLSNESFDQWCFKSKRALEYINSRLTKKYIVKKYYKVIDEVDMQTRKSGGG